MSETQGDWLDKGECADCGESRALCPNRLCIVCRLDRFIREHKEQRARRAPPPPAQLVSALPDRPHPASGRLIAATPINVRGRKDDL